MRRSTLLAGLGALPLASCAAIRSRVNGCVDADRLSDAGITYYARTLTSKHVRGPVAYTIAIATDPHVIENVVYVLPGRGGRAGDVFANLNYGGAFATVIANDPHRRKTMLVAVDSGESYYHPRANGEDRLAVLTEELPRALASFLGTTAQREALVGQSMGGYGALLAAERNPERYAAVAVAGPAIFPSYEDEQRSVGDAFDSRADFVRHDVIAHAGVLGDVRVRIEIGEHDPFLPGARKFHAALPGADFNVEPGCHDDGFWRASAQTLLSHVISNL